MLNYWVIWFWIPNLGTPQPILPYPKYPLENGLINNPPLRSLPCLSNLASDLLATKTFVNSWELSRPFLKFRRKEMWVSRGQEKELKQGGEESIYGSLMAKLWHFQTPSCAVYGNMGCRVFKGGMQNQIDFWQKSISSEDVFVFCQLTWWRVNSHAPKLIFLNEKKIRKFPLIFDINYWLWNSDFGTCWHLATMSIHKIQ